MSSNQFGPGLGQAEPPQQPWRTAPRPRRRRWPWLVAGALVLAVVGGVVWWVQAQPPDPGPANHTPVVLPATLDGRPFDEQFNFATESWLEVAREEFYGDDHAFGGAGYLSRGAQGEVQPPMLNLVVARGYFPQAPDAGLGRAPFTTHGSVTCTNSLEYPESEGQDAGLQVSDSMILCYRVEQHLTVSVMAVGASQSITRDEVAAAVDEAWAQQ